METIIKLLIFGLLPVTISVIFFLLDKNTKFKNLSFWPKQIIIGVVFGGVAICATEFGIPIEGAVINVRDAAPLCAGLIFGAPAGVIAGVIGGVERWFCVFWGGGMYTRVACSISTVVAGIVAAVLRKTMFEDKRPPWIYGIFVGLSVEVFHMLMLFFTNMDDIHKAFSFVTTCSFPMILANCIALTLALLIISLINREKLFENLKRKNIITIIAVWLLVDILVAFSVTCIATYSIQTSTASHEAETKLQNNITAVVNDLKGWANDALLNSAQSAAVEINSASTISNELLDSILAKNSDKYSEIDVINEKGIITYCTNRSVIGYDMASDQQSAEFLCLLHGEKTYTQELQNRGANDDSFKYVGVALAKGGFMQIGINALQMQNLIDPQIASSVTYRDLGDSGRMMVIAPSGIIVSDSGDAAGESIKRFGLTTDFEQPANQLFTVNFNGETQYAVYDQVEGYTIVAMMPESEVFYMRDLTVYLTVFMDILIFCTLFVMIYYLIKNMVVENIHKINDTLGVIARGDLNASCNVRTSEEFTSLSDDINTTVDTLKRYIDEAKERINKELEVATVIQASSLPSEFPPFPDRTEFDIFATMTPAKEVGGDFYDFYFLDEDRLAFLIADVSGKGITGAMFMMKAKAILKGEAEIYDDVEDILSSANDALCEGNEAEMFVTCWLGIIDFSTHVVTWGSAGHNPPVIRRKDGQFEYLEGRPNFVLAGMEGVPYTQHEFELNPGDEILLYTDGVTEATDLNNELYGEDRLLAILNALENPTCEDICHKVKEDIDAFVGEAPQFDDITMLSMKIMR